MKNDKKNILILILLVLLLIIGVLRVNLNTNSKNEETTDSVKFKKEYESLNDKVAYENFKYPKVSLDDSNPFVYKSAEEIVETLKNGTGIIYLGFPKCPWCRNAVNVLSYLNVSEIMYLDMTDQRDSYEVIDGKLEKTKDGTKEYYEILELLDDILEPYEVLDNDVSYDTKEKRVYVPLVIGVKNGKIVGYHIDTVELKDDQSAYSNLTKEQQEELKKIYDDIKEKVYDDICDINKKGC